MKALCTALISVLFLSHVNSQSLLQVDSLKGFPELSIRQELIDKQLGSTELEFHLSTLKRDYIQKKFFPVTTPPTQKQTSQTVNAAPCVNENFGSSGLGPFTAGNSVPGWSLTSGNYSGTCSLSPTWNAGSSNFTVVVSPAIGVPGMYYLPPSPLGGGLVARLNNTVTNDYSVTRLTQTFPVTASNPFFNYAVAAAFLDGPHTCCESAGYQVLFYDCSNNFLCSKSFSMSSCPTQTNALQYNNSVLYHTWQTHAVDLSAYINSCVRVEVIANDCAYAGHYCMLFFDAECGTGPVASTYDIPTIAYCPSSTLALIQAPTTLNSFTWSVPSPYVLFPGQGSASVLPIYNPTVGMVFTISTTSNLNCITSQTFALTNSSVGILSSNTVTSCNPGATGEATLNASGSASGYNFIWTNSSASVVSTSSVLSGVPAGVYNVTVSATPGCGAATGSVTVPAFDSYFVLNGPSVYTMCPNTSMVLQTSQHTVTGNAATITWSPSTNLTINTGYATTFLPAPAPNTSFAITYSVVQTPTGMNCPFTRTFTVNYFDPPIPQLNPIADVCFNSGTIQAIGTPTGGLFTSNAFINSGTGVITPSASGSGVKNVNYVVYSNNCSRSTSASFSVIPLPTLSPQSIMSTCANTPTLLVITGTNTSAWNGVPGASLMITPTVTTTAIASVTDNISNCVNSKTVTIYPIPNPTLAVSSSTSVCEGSTASMSVTGANTFTWQNGSTQSTTTISVLSGLNTFSVAGTNTSTTCKANLSHTILGVTYPTVSILGTTFVCVGELITLTATGADTYTWNSTLASNTFSTYAGAPLLLTLIGANADMCRDTLVLYTIPEECVGLKENNMYALRMFPNPASTALFIVSHSGATLELFESSGKLVLQTILKEGFNELSLLDFAEGLYLLKMSDGGMSATSRLIIGRK